MSKHVHFALDVSPASTNESSLGPSTPPQYAQGLPTQGVRLEMPSFASSYVASAYTSNSHNPSQLHHALVKPTFDFDVSIHPLNNRSISNDIELQKELNSPIAGIPTRCLTLESRHLPWPITISTERYYLTCLDVLVGIHNNLRIQASQAEFQIQSRKKQNEISLAFHDRLERRTAPKLREQEMRKGLRRVDFLPLDTLKFNSLEMRKGSDPWVLHLRR